MTPYLEVYHLTNTQMGVFGSIFGVFGMISYLFGGYLADRVSIRLLLTVSLVGTGLGGFLHLLPLTFPMLVGLYRLLGLHLPVCVLARLCEAVRVLSSPEDKGQVLRLVRGRPRRDRRRHGASGCRGLPDRSERQ